MVQNLLGLEVRHSYLKGLLEFLAKLVESFLRDLSTLLFVKAYDRVRKAITRSGFAVPTALPTVCITSRFVHIGVSLAAQ